MKIKFNYTHSLAEDRQLKDVLRVILTDISTNEHKAELENLNFNVIMVRCFDISDRLMPVCMVILSGMHYQGHFQNNRTLLKSQLKLTISRVRLSVTYANASAMTHRTAEALLVA